MSFFDGEACPDDNLKGILSIHLKLGKYIHSIKIWKSLDFGIDWSVLTSISIWMGDNFTEEEFTFASLPG